MADSELLQQLDKLPKIKQFDAFPKTRPLYHERSSKGGALTVVLVILLTMLAWNEAREYLFGEHGYSFDVEASIGERMQINVDITVAMPCHWLTVDVRDAVGDRIHVTDEEFQMDGTTFEIGHAGRLDSVPMIGQSAGKLIDAARHREQKPIFAKPGKRAAPGQAHFARTAHLVPDGPSCRVYGSVEVKKVTGNLHLTTLGHGYWSFEHTSHDLMNLSHVIHEFSFGPYFPEIAQPLDGSVELTSEHFSVFQYFISIIPTTYVDRWRRKLSTNQYSVTDYTRSVEHGYGVPGLFFKFDVEPLTMTVRERTTTLAQFLVRLAGIVGGVWVCAGYTLRITSRLGRVAKAALRNNAELETPEGYAAAYSSAYAAYPSAAGYNGHHDGGGAKVGGGMPMSTVYGAPGSVLSAKHRSPGVGGGGSGPALGMGSATMAVGAPPYYAPSSSSSPPATALSSSAGGGGGVGMGVAPSLSAGASWLGGAANSVASSARDHAGRAWNSTVAAAAASAGGGGGGGGHRHTPSVQQRIYSEEGRAAW